MSYCSPEFVVYTNILKYITTVLKHKVQGEILTKKKFEKSVQFDSYVRIKATGETNAPLYVFVIENNEIVSKSPLFQKILDTIVEKDIKLIIVSKQMLKNTVLKMLNNPKRKKIKFKTYEFNTFKNNIQTNINVPKHCLLDSKETAKMLADNNIDSVNYLPKIPKRDPQVILINGEPGQVVKIIRCGSTGQEIYYRVIK